MRSEEEIFKMILDFARADEKIRAVVLSGSRANPAAPKDIYQDYDIAFFVSDIKAYYNRPEWIIGTFGKPLIMQMPEAMRYPDGGGHFNYMMIYPDGVRLDLTFEYRKYIDEGEPALLLLDKDEGKGLVPPLPSRGDEYWHIKEPSPLFYYSTCNNFWWCLNNAAKGIVRDELPYVMNMLNEIVRKELHDMVDWYIGIKHGFSLSTGKDSKYIKRYLEPELYGEYLKTYSDADYDNIWDSIYVMCKLFRRLALAVAEHFGFSYNQGEEDGMMAYMEMLRSG